MLKVYSFQRFFASSAKCILIKSQRNRIKSGLLYTVIFMDLMLEGGNIFFVLPILVLLISCNHFRSSVEA